VFFSLYRKNSPAWIELKQTRNVEGEELFSLVESEKTEEVKKKNGEDLGQAFIDFSSA
jgi:hypothetical protein